MSRVLMSHTALRIVAVLLALSIFLFDTFSSVEGAIAVLYVFVVLIVSRTSRRNDILLAALACVVMTAISYLMSHDFTDGGAAALRAIVSLAAIGIGTILALQNQKATQTLLEQARLLNLSHDMIFVRDNSGEIGFWNDAAEQVYGWSAAEARGQIADDLLRTRYSSDREAIETQLRETGRWDGILEQETRSGSRLILDSRWAVQRDRMGRIVGVLETHTDITERQAAHNALVRSERRYRRMINTSRVGIIEENWTGVSQKIAELKKQGADDLSEQLAHPDFVRQARGMIQMVDVNPAFLAMVGIRDSDRFPGTADDVLAHDDTTLSGTIAAFARGDAFVEGETEIIRNDGSLLPVFFTITFPTDEEDGNVMVYIVDIAERRQAQDALQQLQSELAHAARVATLGELTASIAHEVSQPLMAIVTNGEAGMRWLHRDPPEVSEVEVALGRVISEGRRASDIVKRIRAFLKKSPPQKAELAVGILVEEAAALVRREIVRAGVRLQVDIQGNLPAIPGDRIQLQQVLVNLLLNATQAMAAIEGNKLLSVLANSPSPDNVEIVIRDTGPGIADEYLGKLFDPFFTTKQDGMGMGLAICRTTVEAHGGRLAVESDPGRGATFRITLPVNADDLIH